MAFLNFACMSLREVASCSRLDGAGFGGLYKGPMVRGLRPWMWSSTHVNSASIITMLHADVMRSSFIMIKTPPLLE